MNAKFSHKERIDRHLSGKELDRPAVSAWRHFYDRENTREDLVNSMIEFQRKFDWDFMKINPRADYHVEPWGLSPTRRLSWFSTPRDRWASTTTNEAYQENAATRY